MSTAIVLLLLVGGGLTIYYLLNRVTEQGGGSDGDAAAIVDQVLGEANAYRGSRKPGDPPLDGKNRIAPPISDGSGTGGAI
jgi:hypothetical protein